jgi:hypothetical protein
LEQFSKKCDNLAIEQANLLVAMRQRRADILGLSIEEMLKQDNRNALIAQMQAQHAELASWDDASAYVDDMERIAREEQRQEQGVEVCPDCEKASKFGVRCRDCETAREDADLRGERQ